MRYALFGCVCAGTDTLIFWLLVNFAGWEPLVANVASTLVGLTLSFILNRRYTFKVMDNPVRRGLLFFAVGGCGLLIQEVVIAVVFHGMDLDELVAKILAVMLAGLVQFALNRVFTFRASESAPR